MKKTSTIIAIVLACIFIASTASAGRSWTTKEGYVAALSLYNLEKAVEYASNKDFEAFKKVHEANRVFVIKKGLRVYIVERSGLGYIKIRPEGETVELWTLREAVE